VTNVTPYNPEIESRLVALQLKHMSDQMTSMKDQLTAQAETTRLQLTVQAEERKADFKQQMEKMEEKMDGVVKDLTAMKQMADRWKGGFFAMMMASGFIGWLVASALDAFKLWRH
jgi:predicted ribosome quality control (RQC) complex YloA/Tae2 family protein